MPIELNCDDCKCDDCVTCIDGSNFTKAYHRARKYAYAKTEVDGSD